MPCASGPPITAPATGGAISDRELRAFANGDQHLQCDRIRHAGNRWCPLYNLPQGEERCSSTANAVAPLLGIVIVLQIVSLVRARGPAHDLVSRLDQLEKSDNRSESTLREEFAKNRDEAASSGATPRLPEEARLGLEARVLGEARSIRDKYVNPPQTTDFGILFLPSEALYAEVLRTPGIIEKLQRETRVVVAGPTSLAAILNSLQMGFRTLAIQKRSSEVWKTLGAVKNQFGIFSGLLDKVSDKLQQASNTIDEASRKSRYIETRLKKVEELPVGEAQSLLPDLTSSDEDDEGN